MVAHFSEKYRQDTLQRQTGEQRHFTEIAQRVQSVTFVLLNHEVVTNKESGCTEGEPPTATSNRRERGPTKQTQLQKLQSSLDKNGTSRTEFFEHDVKKKDKR